MKIVNYQGSTMKIVNCYNRLIQVPNWANFIVTTSSGDLWCFQFKPKIVRGQWYEAEARYDTNLAENYPTADWQDSLRIIAKLATIHQTVRLPMGRGEGL